MRVAVAVVIAVIAAACGSESRQLDARCAQARGSPPTDARRRPVAKFGTLDSPCGQGHRDRCDRNRGHQHVDQDRLRRRRGIRGRARARQGDVGRGEADDRLVQRAGRHQRSQDHRQLLRRPGAAGHPGDDAGVQRQDLHARRPGLRARREPGARHASSASSRRSPASRSAPRSRADRACNSRSRTPATKKRSRRRTRSRSCSPPRSRRPRSRTPTSRPRRRRATRPPLGYPQAGWKFLNCDQHLQHRRRVGLEAVREQPEVVRGSGRRLGRVARSQHGELPQRVEAGRFQPDLGHRPEPVHRRVRQVERPERRRRQQRLRAP